MKTLIALIGLLTSSPVLAQTATVTYVLEDVWLDPDITGGSPQLMTGRIEWTYTLGDFKNGTGEFIQRNGTHNVAARFEKARAAHEIRLSARENILSVFGSAAAGGRVERFHELPLERQHLALRLAHGLVRHRVFH